MTTWPCCSQRDIRVSCFSYRSHHMVEIDSFQKEQHLARHLAKNWSSPVCLGRIINKCFVPWICLWVREPCLIWGVTTQLHKWQPSPIKYNKPPSLYWVVQYRHNQFNHCMISAWNFGVTMQNKLITKSDVIQICLYDEKWNRLHLTPTKIILCPSFE